MKLYLWSTVWRMKSQTLVTKQDFTVIALPLNLLVWDVSSTLNSLLALAGRQTCQSPGSLTDVEYHQLLLAPVWVPASAPQVQGSATFPRLPKDTGYPGEDARFLGITITKAHTEYLEWRRNNRKHRFIYKVCMHAQLLSRVWLFATLWAVAR